MIKVNSIAYDKVIKSHILTGEVEYGYAVENLCALIGRFKAQRKLQNQSFYDRLRRDIVIGCIMPPITIAFIDEGCTGFSSCEDATKYVAGVVGHGYILDGMQRLHNLEVVSKEPGFDSRGKLYVTVVVSSSKDMLLYRMITLNNGQRPMSARHQIETLTEELFDFKELDIDVQTEKERAEKIVRGAFNLSDISKGYLAFFTGSLHNDNNKIISEKMDEIIVGKIMESGLESPVEFQQVLALIDRLSGDPSAKSWLKVQNNLIGFCTGIKSSYEVFDDVSPEEFGRLAAGFDEAFKSINAAKVNLGKFRRELSSKYIAKIGEFRGSDVNSLIEYFVDETAS